MALTLAQASVGMTNPIDQQVVDKFTRKSEILARLPFANATAQEGGNTLAYTFVQEKTPATAASRALNAEYTANEAVNETKTVNLAITGGSYEIDRVVAKNPVNRTTQVAHQTERKAEATVNYFHWCFINGNRNEDENSFDGLNLQLKDSDTEVTSSLDIASMTDAEAQELCNEFDEVISRMVRKPDLILTSTKGKIKAKEAARRIGYFSHDKNDFGRAADFYDGIEIVDLGQFYNGSSLVDIIPVRSAAEYIKVAITSAEFTTDGSLYTKSGTTYTAVSSGSYSSSTAYYKLVGAAKSTDYYFVCLGEEELCGLSPDASKAVETHQPDFTQAQAVHKGDVEFITGIALKNTKAAAVLRGVVVKA